LHFAAFIPKKYRATFTDTFTVTLSVKSESKELSHQPNSKKAIVTLACVGKEETVMNSVIPTYKRLEQPLRHLVAIAEQAREAIAVIAPDGSLSFANKAWAKMHGYNPADELVGKHISTFHTEQQMKDDLIPCINETKSRGQLAGPIEHMRKDRTTFPTQTKMTMVKDGQGTPIGLIVFATEITESKRAESEMKQCRTRFEQQVQELTAQLKAANDKLRQETEQRRQVEQQLQQCHGRIQQNAGRQIVEPPVVHEECPKKIVEGECTHEELREYRDQLERHVDLLTTQLTAANEKLRRQTGPMRTDDALLQSIIHAKESNDGVVLFTKALSQLGARLI
jgi:PAS domain S-box-containing protein